MPSLGSLVAYIAAIVKKNFEATPPRWKRGGATPRRKNRLRAGRFLKPPPSLALSPSWFRRGAAGKSSPPQTRRGGALATGVVMIAPGAFMDLASKVEMNPANF